MGFCEVLTIVFVTLRIIGIIDWSWWLVLLPEIIAFVLYVVLIGGYTALWVSSAISINKGFKNLSKWE